MRITPLPRAISIFSPGAYGDERQEKARSWRSAYEWCSGLSVHRKLSVAVGFILTSGNESNTSGISIMDELTTLAPNIVLQLEAAFGKSRDFINQVHSARVTRVTFDHDG